MPNSLSLNEYRDLEAALQAGHGPEVLTAALTLTPLPSSPAAVLRLWLQAVYQHRPRPSVRFAQLSRHCLIALVVFGVVLGVGAAQYALHYDGSEPVDVMRFLACLVLPQIALLLLAGGALITRRLWSKDSLIPKIGLVPSWLMSWIESRIYAEVRIVAPAVSFRRFCRPVEAWYLVSMTQVFGVVFNLAALSTALGIVTFSDLAFAWGSTLPVEANAVHAAASLIGMPFAPLVPPPEAVAASRYSRLERRYTSGSLEQRAVNAAATTVWWPFLAASLVFYGLLPRALLALLSYAMFWLGQRRLPLQSFAINQLLRGIFAQRQALTQHHASQSALDDPTLISPAASAEAGPGALASYEAGAVIVWRDAPWDDALVTETLQKLVGQNPTLILRSEGDFDGYLTAARLPVGGPVYVLVDAFETLQKALIRYLAGLRQQLPTERLIVILPVREQGGRLELPASAEQKAYWHKATQALADPFLGAELGESV